MKIRYKLYKFYTNNCLTETYYNTIDEAEFHIKDFFSRQTAQDNLGFYFKIEKLYLPA